MWLRTAALCALWLGAQGVRTVAAAPAEDDSSASTAQVPSQTPDELVPPRLAQMPQITYPQDVATQENPPTGEVVVTFVITVEGTTSEIAIAQGLHPRLDELAREAVARLRYEPARYRGEPVEISTRLSFEFSPPPRNDDTSSEQEATDAAPEVVPTATDGPTLSEGDTAAAPSPSKALPSSLTGTVLEAGQRTAIPGVTVTASQTDPDARVGRIRKRTYDGESNASAQWQASTTTDENGRFELPVPAGKIKLRLTSPGFRDTAHIEATQPRQQLSVKYYLDRSSDNPYRTVVRSTRAQREEVARRTLVAEEITNLPGTQGDALKALQNFPGVARAPFGLGLLAIRGTGPNDSAVFLGWHEIPQLFHFGGITSVFNSDILKRIDFVPGNFDSRYGDALGGIVDVQPRAGRRDGYHGYVDADVFDAGFLVEGRLGKGSFAVAARRSYIDVLLPRIIPKDAGIKFTLAPRYWDDQILFDYPLGGGQFSVRVFGSRDRLKLISADPNEVTEDDRNRFENQRYFHRADLVYTKRHGRYGFVLTPSYRYDKFLLNISNVVGFTLSAHNFNFRGELDVRISQRAKLRVGTELRTTFFQVDVNAPPIGGGRGVPGEAQRTSNVTGTLVTPAVYTTLELAPTPRFTLYPGARFSYYAGAFRRPSVEPRLRAAWQVAKDTTLKAGVGLFYQAPQPVEFSGVFGNPRVGLQRAAQTSLGVSQQLPWNLNLDVTGYFTQLWDLIGPSSSVVNRPDNTVGPETFANNQLGRAYGLEFMLRKQLTGQLFGWIAYTVSRSERKPEGESGYSLASFDQTHILTAVAVWRLPHHWQLGGRFRLVSGNPTTAVQGAAFDAQSGSYRPFSGPTNGDRLPLFHQLDLRVDRTFVWRKLSWALYLDIQNVYNHQNVEFWNYAYDYSTRVPVAGLPIIPSIGTKLEF